jgi:hypothetical protein
VWKIGREYTIRILKGKEMKNGIRALKILRDLNEIYF